MREEWTYKKLGEVCDVTMGQSPEGDSLNEQEGIEFHQGKTCFGERFLGVSSVLTNAPTKLAEAHSVLLCVRAPVGFPNITERVICIGRGLCSLSPSNSLNSNFLFYALLNKQSYFEKNATGSTFKAISSKVINQAEIPLPPKSQQEAIVAELDEINSLLALKREQSQKYDKLAQSLFYEMFGDPVENEKGWEVKKWKEVLSIINGKNQREVEDEAGLYPICGSGGIMGRANRYLCPSYCTIIGRKGNINKPIFMKEPFWNVDTAFGLKPDITVLDPYYLFYFCKDYDFEHLNKAVTIPSLTKADLLQVSIPLPPLPLQQQFASRIEQIESQKQQVQAAIEKLETLLASRMQYWFE